MHYVQWSAKGGETDGLWRMVAVVRDKVGARPHANLVAKLQKWGFERRKQCVLRIKWMLFNYRLL